MNHKKDFDTWSLRKKEINKTEKSIYFSEREVWWCQIGINIGVEIDGKEDLFLRPIIIIKKFNQNMALIVPTTGKVKSGKYYCSIVGDSGRGYCACLSQIRLVSVKRLVRKIATISEFTHAVLIEKVLNVIKP